MEKKVLPVIVNHYVSCVPISNQHLKHLFFLVLSNFQFFSKKPKLVFFHLRFFTSNHQKSATQFLNWEINEFSNDNSRRPHLKQFLVIFPKHATVPKKCQQWNTSRHSSFENDLTGDIHFQNIKLNYAPTYSPLAQDTCQLLSCHWISVPALLTGLHLSLV